MIGARVPGEVDSPGAQAPKLADAYLIAAAGLALPKFSP